MRESPLRPGHRCRRRRCSKPSYRSAVVGTYVDDLTDIPYRVVEEEDDRLRLGFGYGRGEPLRRAEDGSYALGQGMRAWLVEGPDGVSIRVQSATGPPKDLTRVQALDRDAPVDLSLLGDYYSPELGAWYRIEGDEEGLFLWHRKHGRIRMTAFARDLYRSNQFGGLRVFRDASGVARGFTASTGRVWRVRFDRRARPS